MGERIPYVNNYGGNEELKSYLGLFYKLSASCNLCNLITVKAVPLSTRWFSGSFFM